MDNQRPHLIPIGKPGKGKTPGLEKRKEVVARQLTNRLINDFCKETDRRAPGPAWEVVDDVLTALIILSADWDHDKTFLDLERLSSFVQAISRPKYTSPVFRIADNDMERAVNTVEAICRTHPEQRAIVLPLASEIIEKAIKRYPGPSIS